MTTRTSRKLGIAIAGALVSVGAATVASSTESAHGEGQPSTPVITSPAITGDPSDHLSLETTNNLARYHGVSVEPVADAALTSDVAIDARTASRVAASQFNFVNDGGALRSVSLARITTNQRGAEVAAPGRPSRTVKPDLKDRLSWVVVFDGFSMHLGGPKRLDGSERPEVAPNAELVVFVDPFTGRVLAASQH